MKYLLFVLAIMLHINSFAQKETYDLISYTLPRDNAGIAWKKEELTTIISYTAINKGTGGWCRINIVKSTISKGSIAQDFESEWQELVVKNYKPTGAPQLNEIVETDGWKILAGAGKFIFNKADAVAMLTTASGYERCVSIVAITNSQDFIKDIEALISSVDLVKPATNPQQLPNKEKTSVIGTWGATASDNSDFRMKNGIMNSISRQYTFNGDGSYYFVSKTFDPLMDKLLLGKETGTYQVKGDVLTVNPGKSVLEAWSKKDGTDKWGKLLNSQSIPLEKASYTFTMHYFSGTQIWSLVLQADKATQRDGPHSNSNTFKNAWYYSPISLNNPVIILPEGQRMTSAEIKKEPAPQVKTATDAPGKPHGFTFTTTNFDDGWTSTVKDDWVEATKSNIKVLIHYPNKTADDYNPDLLDGLKNAWNVLVAPRYSSATNMQFKPLSGWESVEFAEAEMVEKSSGRSVYVVLFKKNFSGGSGKYLEFITPDKQSFISEFGGYQNTASSGWDKMAGMANYNKFAVAAADLPGKWTNNFTGMTQYVNAYTGANAGMNTHASNENFEFLPGNTYKWDVGVASGFVGNLKFQSYKSSGKFSMAGNWQLSFSDIEGKPKTYNVQFTCIKGTRLLWIGETSFGRKE